MCRAAYPEGAQPSEVAVLSVVAMNGRQVLVCDSVTRNCDKLIDAGWLFSTSWRAGGLALCFAKRSKFNSNVRNEMFIMLIHTNLSIIASYQH